MYDPELAHSLKYNVAEFSAFKETSFRKQLESILTNSGEVVPWSEFRNKANELHIEYNQKWLKTEYHHTVATANAAGNWREIEANADLYPNAKIVIVNDNRVRDLHRQWDGLTLPINHAFWKTHIVPFDWGCRCHIVSSDDEVSIDIPKIAIKKEFQNNPAISGKVFAATPYTEGLASADIKEAKSRANKHFENTILQKPRKEQFNEVFKKGKGNVSKHLLVKKGDDYNDILSTAKAFAYKGKKAEILPEVYKNEVAIRKSIFPNLKSKTSNPDLKVGSAFYDIKRPKAIKNIVGNANGASKQGAIAVISNSQLDKVLTDEIIQERVKDIFRNKNYLFNEVVFMRDGELIVFNRTGV